MTSAFLPLLLSVSAVSLTAAARTLNQEGPSVPPLVGDEKLEKRTARALKYIGSPITAMTAAPIAPFGAMGGMMHTTGLDNLYLRPESPFGWVANIETLSRADVSEAHIDEWRYATIVEAGNITTPPPFKLANYYVPELGGVTRLSQYNSIEDLCGTFFRQMTYKQADDLYASGAKSIRRHPKGKTRGCVVGDDFWATQAAFLPWDGKVFQPNGRMSNVADNMYGIPGFDITTVPGTYGLGRSWRNVTEKAIVVQYPPDPFWIMQSRINTLNMMPGNFPDYRDEIREVPSMPGLFMGKMYVRPYSGGDVWQGPNPGPYRWLGVHFVVMQTEEGADQYDKMLDCDKGINNAEFCPDGELLVGNLASTVGRFIPGTEGNIYSDVINGDVEALGRAIRGYGLLDQTGDGVEQIETGEVQDIPGAETLLAEVREARRDAAIRRTAAETTGFAVNGVTRNSAAEAKPAPEGS